MVRALSPDMCRTERHRFKPQTFTLLFIITINLVLNDFSLFSVYKLVAWSVPYEDGNTKIKRLDTLLKDTKVK